MNDNIDEKSFLEQIETNYFQVSNYLFDFDFTVEANKRIIKKDFYGKGEHKYINTTEIRSLNANEKLVFVYICRCANNGRKAFPSYSTIGSRCSISKESARLAVETLYKNKFILKKNRGYVSDRDNQTNKTFTNVYYVNNDLKSLVHVEKSRVKTV